MKISTQVFWVWILVYFVFVSQTQASPQNTKKWSDYSQEKYVEKLVNCQLAIQEYKWSKNIWPEANQEPKPAFNEVADVEANYSQVLDGLKKQAVLVDKFNITITDVMLQQDLYRMARNSLDGKGLKKLFAVLDDDPETIARCLSQPYLVSKIFNKNYYWNSEIHQPTKTKAENELASYWQGKNLDLNDTQVSTVIYQMKTSEKNTNHQNQDDSAKQTVIELDEDQYLEKLRELENKKLQELETVFVYPELLAQSDYSIEVKYLIWTKQSANHWLQQQDDKLLSVSTDFPFKLPEITGSEYNYNLKTGIPADTWKQLPKPEARSTHTAVWTGSEMIIWGGIVFTDRLNTGGIYNPITDMWMSTNINGAPSARNHHSAVWTGSKMVVWGGMSNGSGAENTGGIYYPQTDTWSSTSVSGAPTARSLHTVVWTGSEMIVWGGLAGSSHVNTGGVFNPVSNQWSSTSTQNAPAGRNYHTAVWADNKMIVWGGRDENSINFNTGGIYDPSNNQWTSTNIVNAPLERYGHTAIWSGNEMIIWSGYSSGYLNTGGRYNPISNIWLSTSTLGAPASRADHTAVWADSKMIVWGGIGSNFYNTGGIYDPLTDDWSNTTTVNAPSTRFSHSAIWDNTNNKMLIWGGQTNDIYRNTGGIYDLANDNWTSTNSIEAPSVRKAHTAVWTGSEMVVWGGVIGYSSYLNTGGVYNPLTNMWFSTSDTNAPSVRKNHTAVWTGNEMVVWGGYDGSHLDTGGIYDPVTDIWLDTSTLGLPPAREKHTAVWTGDKMIVWGGKYNNSYIDSGIIYDLDNDIWTDISALNAPHGRNDQTAVWTGNEMIIWGGYSGGGDYKSTGGIYDPLTDIWSNTSSSNVPVGRDEHTAIWTGNEMVVWGGYDGSNTLNSGGTYDPVNNIWSSTSSINVPSNRSQHTAVWTGNAMIVWGGTGDFENLNSMGIYYPHQTYSISGTLTGLQGNQVILQNNAGDDLTLTANGTFEFSGTLNTGFNYEVTVLSNPVSPAQNCIVTNGSGTVTADVTDVLVQCNESVDLIFRNGFEAGPSDLIFRDGFDGP